MKPCSQDLSGITFSLWENSHHMYPVILTFSNMQTFQQEIVIGKKSVSWKKRSNFFTLFVLYCSSSDFTLDLSQLNMEKNEPLALQPPFQTSASLLSIAHEPRWGALLWGGWTQCCVPCLPSVLMTRAGLLAQPVSMFSNFIRTWQSLHPCNPLIL